MAITIIVDSTTEEERGLTEDTTDPSGCTNMSSYVYPVENQDQYKAQISFRLMEIVPPVSIGNAGGEHIKKANASFRAARDRNKDYRLFEKTSKALLQESRTTDDPILKNSKENKSAELKSSAQEAKEKSIKHSREGRESLNEATEAFFKSSDFSDRQVLPSHSPGIKLYLPVGFQQTDGFQISGTELGMLGGGALAGMSSGSSILKSTLDQFSQGLGSIFDMAKGELKGGQAAVVGARLANKLAPREVADAFSIAAGVTVNPNLRSIFKGVNLREYAFQFKFLPKSLKEAREVEKIIKQFRVHAYPDIIEVGPLAAGYKYPNLFRIAVYVEQQDEVIGFDDDGNEYTESVTRRKRVGNRMKDCYLRSVSTNYNPSSMAFHPDGRPVEIDLSLSFVEEVTVNRKDIEEGY